MTKGLHALHNSGYIHRDICLTSFGRTSKNSDHSDAIVLHKFENACLIATPDVELNIEQRNSKHMIWKPPETISGSVYDVQSDIFCLGMTLFEIDALQKLSEQNDYAKIRQINLRGMPPIIPDYFNNAIGNFIEKCCRVDPKLRITLPMLINDLNALVPQEQKVVETGHQQDFTYSQGEVLVSAVSLGDFDTVKRMVVDENVPADACTSLQWTPLLESILRNDEKIIGLLLQCEANVNHVSNVYLTPIVLAAQRCNLELMESLIERNANIHTTIYPAGLELNTACMTGNVAIAKEVVSAGISPTRPGLKGETLMELSDCSVLEFLKSVDEFGPFEGDATMLMRAAYYGETDVVKKIVSYGVNVGLKDSHNKTAMDYARERGHEDIVQILKNKKPAPLEATFFDFTDLSDIHLLGEGKFGVTYRCTLNLGNVSIKSVAKVSKLKPGDDEWRELQVLKVVPHHKCVLGLLGLLLDFKHNDKETVALIVPFMAGGSLQSYVKYKLKNKSMMLARTILRFIRDMVASVGHLHASGFVHVDLALRNFLIAEGQLDAKEQRVVVADFGLSRQTVEGSARINEGETLPVWSLPPEVHNLLIYYPSSDIWQIGFSIWEFQGLFGHPFIKCNQLSSFASFLKDEMVTKQQRVPLPFIRRRHVPKELFVLIQELCETCCRYDFVERPTAAELTDIIDTMIVKFDQENPEALQIQDEKVDESKVTYGGLESESMYLYDLLHDKSSDIESVHVDEDMTTGNHDDQVYYVYQNLDIHTDSTDRLIK